MDKGTYLGPTEKEKKEPILQFFFFFYFNKQTNQHIQKGSTNWQRTQEQTKKGKAAEGPEAYRTWDLLSLRWAQAPDWQHLLNRHQRLANIPSTIIPCSDQKGGMGMGMLFRMDWRVRWQLSLTFSDSLWVVRFHLGQRQLIGNIRLLKCQNAQHLCLNTNRTTRGVKINPHWVEVHVISFS